MPTYDDIMAAAKRIAPYAHRTPVLTCAYFDRELSAQLFFKCENFQKVGAFKFRGACNAVMALSPQDAARGVATHSSGNHAQALALAAKLRGIPAHIVMPENSSVVKINAVKGYGAVVTLCEATMSGRETCMADVLAKTGAVFVHPFNDHLVIAGQGTAALELHKDIPGLDIVLTPLGGGGLTSGTAIAFAAEAPNVEVIPIEPAGADDGFRSLKEGRIVPSVDPKTIADGLRTSLGPITFEILRTHVKRIVTVQEPSIVQAMRLIWERMKILVEPSSALPLAALLERSIDVRGKRVGIILSGGNVDLDKLPW